MEKVILFRVNLSKVKNNMLKRLFTVLRFYGREKTCLPKNVDNPNIHQLVGTIVFTYLLNEWSFYLIAPSDHQNTRIVLNLLQKDFDKYWEII